MSEPRRWLEESDAPAGLGELLSSARMDEPTPEQLVKLRASIGFLILPPGGGGPGPTGGGASGGGTAAGGTGAAGIAGAAATGAIGKVVAITLGTLVVAGLGGGLMLRNAAVDTPAPIEAFAPVAPPPAVVEPVVAPEPEAVVVAPPPSPRPVIAAPRPPKPVVATPAPEAETRKQTPPVPAPAPAVAANGEDEVDLLQSAMSAAQSGRSADALAAVDSHVRAFPKSALAQEREAIAIEALVNLGRMPEAKTRIDRFRAAWPTSTHLLRLESLLH